MSESRSSILPKRALHLNFMAFVARAALVLAVLPLLAGARVSSSQLSRPRCLREKHERSFDANMPSRFYYNYIEQGRDVDISMLGKVSVGPMQTFEVRLRTRRAAWRRLIAVDGKPLDRAELARRRRASQETRT